MKKNFLRTLSVLMAMLMALSVMSASAFAAEAEYEEEEIVAGVGATKPVYTKLEPCREGVIIRWESIDGAVSYRVERNNDGWQKLTETKELYFVDKDVVSGNIYQYRLTGLKADGSSVTYSVAKSLTYYAIPRITAVEAVADGVHITWEKDEGIAKIALYRMESSGWKRITSTTASAYTDKEVSRGNTYRYTIRPLTSGGNFLCDDYDNTGVTAGYLKTPALRAENAAGGVKLSWDAVEGAGNYRVYYKNSKGGWTQLVTTKETSVLDDDVRSNHNYTYTVRCLSADGKTFTSYYDTAGKAIKYIAAPVLKSAKSEGDGIRISWEKSDGAAKYRVFYKNSKGDWSRLGDTASTSLLDTDVRSGNSYTYTVRCMNASGDYISGYYSEGIRGTYLNAPVLKLSNGADGVDISWEAVKGAVNYRIYYYGSKGWTKLTDTTKTSFTDTDVKSNQNYTYTARCITADGKGFTSTYLAGKKIKYYAAPKITDLTNTESGVKITWGAVSGAAKYRVYYYGRNGWTKMSDTASTSYVDKVVASGTTYKYTVRCLDSSGNFISYYKPGVSFMYVAPPDFKLTANDKSITISWNAVKGAELYRVYYMGKSGWKKLADTTKTSFEDTDVRQGNTYTYTVRCLSADGTKFTSDYHAGKSIKLIGMPHITELVNTTKGVDIRWAAVEGAAKYRVYYKGKSGWKKLTETTKTSFEDTDVSSGNHYTYTVQSITSSGAESSYDTTGTVIRYIAAPRDLKAENYQNSVKVSWTPSVGAEKYRVYYYGRNGWTKLAETTESYAIDDIVASGTTYRYTVRCISADGKSFTSDCLTPGVSCKYIAMPALKAADFTTNGIKIAWSASNGAEKYRVYYYGSKGWTKLTDTTATSVVDTDVSSGHNYRYTVRCITADGKSFASDYETPGVKVYYVAAPKMVSKTVGNGSLTFTWNAPNGAKKYRVYKKVSGSWKRLTDTASTSYTDTDVDQGSTYSYTVRVINEEGNAFCSGYDPNGFIIKIDSSVVTDGFVYYNQGDYSYPYGDDTIAYSGCGPTCFAMIASTLTGKSITPIDAVKWCGNKYYVDNVGTAWGYFQAASNQFGITMEKQYGKTEFSSVVAALKKGKYAISAQSAGRFTRGGHFIVLAGITSDNKIIVYDPNGGNHYVGTAFAQSEITAAGTQYWVFDK